MMKNVSVLALSLVLAAGAASYGCSGAPAEQPAAQTSANALTKAPVGANTHGMVKIFGDALGDVALRADQRAELEKLAQAAEARHAPIVEERKQLMLAIADQVEAGSIDRSALQPKIDRIVADADKARPDDQAALARVHAILDTDQRNAFVDAFEAQLKAKRGEHHEGFGKMKALADELKLTDDQRTQIRDTLKQGHEGQQGHPKFSEMMTQLHDRKDALETFRTDKFDATRLAPTNVKEHTAFGQGRMIGAAEKVVPLLTPEQRKIAADKLRSMASSGDMPMGQ